VIVLDASVWVSALQPDDVNHEISDQWLVRWTSSNPIFVPSIFLAEVGGAIARRTGNSVLGSQIVEDIVGDPMVQLVMVDLVLAKSAARHAVTLFLRGADAVYVALAAQLGLPLITWDQEQLTRASNLVTAQSPTL
jgi:predicted nucleic acid-binding protein